MDNRLEVIKRLFSPNIKQHQIKRTRVRLCRPISLKQLEEEKKPRKEYTKKVITTKVYTKKEIKQLEEEDKLLQELRREFYIALARYNKQ